MKRFIIVSEVEVIQTLQYGVEANSLEEAIQMVCEGELRGEEHVIDEEIKWETETNIIDEEIIDVNYKVGDRVVITDEDGHCFKIGFEGVIIDTETYVEDNNYVIDVTNSPYQILHHDQFHLIEDK